MKSKLAFVTSILESIKKENLYRVLNYGRINGPYINFNGKNLLNLCSNDYLGLSISTKLGKRIQSSSRLVSGNDPSFNILEKKLAKHKSQQNSLVFPTGYMANLGAISAVIQKNDLILSDELNHASIIEACKLTEGRISIFKHNDMKDLEKKIKQKSKHKFIISEGVFSMDGDFANLKRINEIAEKNNAVTILDDAHKNFVMGENGKGTADYLGVSKQIDLYISSLSKGLGSFGGYIASENNIIDLCVNKSKSFIYTSALPNVLVDDAITKFDSNRNKNQNKLAKNTKLFSNGLKQLGFNIKSKTHIIPIIIGSEKTAVEFGKYLFNHAIFAQPIRFPTVPKNKSRIRISITARFSSSQLNFALQIFEKAGKKFKIL